MFEERVLELLRKYLGDYVAGLDREALRISVWKGDVVLKNLQLKPAALAKLKLPVVVQSGVVGTLRLKVPWSQLGKQPVVLEMDRVYVLVSPLPSIQTPEEQAAMREQDFQKKQERLDQMTLAWIQTQFQGRATEEENKAWSRWFQAYLDTVLGNLQLCVTNVHVRYEDRVTQPGLPFAAGATLQSLEAFTVDASRGPTFVPNSMCLLVLRKAVRLERFAVYLEHDFQPYRPPDGQSWQSLKNGIKEWDSVFYAPIYARDAQQADGHPPGSAPVSSSSASASSVSLGSVSGASQHFLLRPVNGMVYYERMEVSAMHADRRASFEASSGESGPHLRKHTFDLLLEELSVCVSRRQYQSVLGLLEACSSYQLRAPHRHRRPCEPPLAAPAAWWRYAIGVVLTRNTSDGFTLSKRQYYRDVYCKRPADERIMAIERELDFGVCLIFRCLAIAHAADSPKPQSQPLPLGSPARPEPSSSNPHALPHTLIKHLSRRSVQNDAAKWTIEERNKLNELIGFDMDSLHEIIDTDASKAELGAFDFKLQLQMVMVSLVDDSANESKVLLETKLHHLDASIVHRRGAYNSSMQLARLQVSSPEGVMVHSGSTIATSQANGSASKHTAALRMEHTLYPKESDIHMAIRARVGVWFVVLESVPIQRVRDFFASPRASVLELAHLDEVTQQQLQASLSTFRKVVLDVEMEAPHVALPLKDSHGTIETTLLISLGHFIVRHNSTTPAGKPSKRTDSFVHPADAALFDEYSITGRDIFAAVVDGNIDWPTVPQLTPQLLLPGASSSEEVLDDSYDDDDDEFLDAVSDFDELEETDWGESATEKGLGSSSVFSRNSGPFSEWLQRLEAGSNAVHPVLGHFEMSGRLLSSVAGGATRTRLLRLSLSLPSVDLRYSPHRQHQIFRVLQSFATTPSGPQPWHSPEYGVELSVLPIRSSARRWHPRWAAMQGAYLYIAEDRLSSAYASCHHLGSNFNMTPLEPQHVGGVQGVFAVHTSDVASNPIAIMRSPHTVLLRVESATGLEHLVKLLQERRKAVLHRAKSPSVPKSVVQGDLENLASAGSTPSSPSTPNTPNNTPSSFKTPVPSSVMMDQSEVVTFEAAVELSRLTIRLEGRPLCTPTHFSREIPLVAIEAAGVTAGHISRQHDSMLSFRLESLELMNLLEGGECLARSFDTDPHDESSGQQRLHLQYEVCADTSPAYKGFSTKLTIQHSGLFFYLDRPAVASLIQFNSDLGAESCARAQANAVRERSSQITERSKSSSWRANVEECLGPLETDRDQVTFHLRLEVQRVDVHMKLEDSSTLGCIFATALKLDVISRAAHMEVVASLGNLRLADHTFEPSHLYHWILNLKDDLSDSLVELRFKWFHDQQDSMFPGFDYSLDGKLSSVRVVFLYRYFLQLINYFCGLTPPLVSSSPPFRPSRVESEDRLPVPVQVNPWWSMKLDVVLNEPLLVWPKNSQSPDGLEIPIESLKITNTLEWVGWEFAPLPAQPPDDAAYIDSTRISFNNFAIYTIQSGSRLSPNLVKRAKEVQLDLTLRFAKFDPSQTVPGIETIIESEELHMALSDVDYALLATVFTENLWEEGDMPAYSLAVEEVVASRLQSSATNEEEGMPTFLEKMYSAQHNSFVRLPDLNLEGLGADGSPTHSSAAPSDAASSPEDAAAASSKLSRHTATTGVRVDDGSGQSHLYSSDDMVAIAHEAEGPRVFCTSRITVKVGRTRLDMLQGTSASATALARLDVRDWWLVYDTRSNRDWVWRMTLPEATVTDSRRGAAIDRAVALRSGAWAETLPPVAAGLETKVGAEMPDAHAHPMAASMCYRCEDGPKRAHLALKLQMVTLVLDSPFVMAVSEFFVTKREQADDRAGSSIKQQLSSDIHLGQGLDTTMGHGVPFYQPGGGGDVFYAPQHLKLSSSMRIMADGPWPTLPRGELVYDGMGHALELPKNPYLRDGARMVHVPVIVLGENRTLRFRNVDIVNAHQLATCISLGANSRIIADPDGSDNVTFDSPLRLKQREALSTASAQKRWSALRRLTLHQKAALANQPVKATEAVIEPVLDMETQWQTEYEIEAVGLRMLIPGEVPSKSDASSPAEARSYGAPQLIMEKIPWLHVALDLKLSMTFFMEERWFETNAHGVRMSLARRDGNVGWSPCSDPSDEVLIEPFDTDATYSCVANKQYVKLQASAIQATTAPSSLSQVNSAITNFQFVNMAGSRMDTTVSCIHFDFMHNSLRGQNSSMADYGVSFWRPRAPSGYSILGDCVTMGHRFPSSPALAVSLKCGLLAPPTGFKRIWSSPKGEASVWWPIAPQGFKSLGCVVNFGTEKPSPGTVSCIRYEFVTSAPLAERLIVYPHVEEEGVRPEVSTDATMCCWCIDNLVSSFLMTSTSDLPGSHLVCELRSPLIETFRAKPEEATVAKEPTPLPLAHTASMRNQTLSFKTVREFSRIWRDTSKFGSKISFWRPRAPEGYAIFGDCVMHDHAMPHAVQVVRTSCVDVANPVSFRAVYVAGNGRKPGLVLWEPIPPSGYKVLGYVATETLSPPETALVACVHESMTLDAPGDGVPLWTQNSRWPRIQRQGSSQSNLAKAALLAAPFKVPFKVAMQECMTLWPTDRSLHAFTVYNAKGALPKGRACILNQRKLLGEGERLSNSSLVGTLTLPELQWTFTLNARPVLCLSIKSVECTLSGRDSNNARVSVALEADLQVYNARAKTLQHLRKSTETVEVVNQNSAWEHVVETWQGDLRFEREKAREERGQQSTATHIRINSRAGGDGMNVTVSHDFLETLLGLYSSVQPTQTVAFPAGPVVPAMNRSSSSSNIFSNTKNKLYNRMPSTLKRLIPSSVTPRDALSMSRGAGSFASLTRAAKNHRSVRKAGFTLQNELGRVCYVRMLRVKTDHHTTPMLESSNHDGVSMTSPFVLATVQNHGTMTIEPEFDSFVPMSAQLRQITHMPMPRYLLRVHVAVARVTKNTLSAHAKPDLRCGVRLTTTNSTGGGGRNELDDTHQEFTNEVAVRPLSLSALESLRTGVDDDDDADNTPSAMVEARWEQSFVMRLHGWGQREELNSGGFGANAELSHLKNATIDLFLEQLSPTDGDSVLLCGAAVDLGALLSRAVLNGTTTTSESANTADVDDTLIARSESWCPLLRTHASSSAAAAPESSSSRAHFVGRIASCGELLVRTEVWKDVQASRLRETSNDIAVATKALGHRRQESGISAEEPAKSAAALDMRAWVGLDPTGPWTPITSEHVHACSIGGADVVTEPFLRVDQDNFGLRLRSPLTVRNNTHLPMEVSVVPVAAKASSRKARLQLSRTLSKTRDEKAPSGPPAQGERRNEEVFENQRYQPIRGWGSSYPGHMLPTDRRRYSDSNGSQGSKEFPQKDPALGWVWASDWELDMEGLSDPEGWVYAVDMKYFVLPHSANPKVHGALHYVRRRRWIRSAVLVDTEAARWREPTRHVIGHLAVGECIAVPGSFLPDGDSASPQWELSVRPMVEEFSAAWGSSFKILGQRKKEWLQPSPLLLGSTELMPQAMSCPLSSRIHDEPPDSSASPRSTQGRLSIVTSEDALSLRPSLGSWHSNRMDMGEFWLAVHGERELIGSEDQPFADRELCLHAPLKLKSQLPCKAHFVLYSVEKERKGERKHHHAVRRLIPIAEGSLLAGASIPVHAMNPKHALVMTLEPEQGWRTNEPQLIYHPDPLRDLPKHVELVHENGGRIYLEVHRLPTLNGRWGRQEVSLRSPFHLLNRTEYSLLVATVANKTHFVEDLRARFDNLTRGDHEGAKMASTALDSFKATGVDKASLNDGVRFVELCGTEQASGVRVSALTHSVVPPGETMLLGCLATSKLGVHLGVEDGGVSDTIWLQDLTFQDHVVNATNRNGELCQLGVHAAEFYLPGELAPLGGGAVERSAAGGSFTHSLQVMVDPHIVLSNVSGRSLMLRQAETTRTESRTTTLSAASTRLGPGKFSNLVFPMAQASTTLQLCIHDAPWSAPFRIPTPPHGNGGETEVLLRGPDDETVVILVSTHLTTRATAAVALREMAARPSVCVVNHTNFRLRVHQGETEEGRAEVPRCASVGIMWAPHNENHGLWLHATGDAEAEALHISLADAHKVLEAVQSPDESVVTLPPLKVATFPGEFAIVPVMERGLLTLHVASHTAAHVLRGLSFAGDEAGNAALESGSSGVGNLGGGAGTIAAASAHCEWRCEVLLDLLTLSIVDHVPEEIVFLGLKGLYVDNAVAGNVWSSHLLIDSLQVDDQLTFSKQPVMFAKVLPSNTLASRMEPLRPGAAAWKFKELISIEVMWKRKDRGRMLEYPKITLKTCTDGVELRVHEPIIWRIRDMVKRLSVLLAETQVLANTATDQTPVKANLSLLIRQLSVSKLRAKLSFRPEPDARPKGSLGGSTGVAVTLLANLDNAALSLDSLHMEGLFTTQAAFAVIFKQYLMRQLRMQVIPLLTNFAVLDSMSGVFGHMSAGMAALSMDERFKSDRTLRRQGKPRHGLKGALVDGCLALSKGVFHGLSGVVYKPVKGAREGGMEGFASGVGKGIIGVVLQPSSGVMDMMSAAAEGASTAYSGVKETVQTVLLSKGSHLRQRLPRAIGASRIVRPYVHSAATGQQVLRLAQWGTAFYGSELWYAHTKFSRSDRYDYHLDISALNTLVLTNKRLMLVQRPSEDARVYTTEPSFVQWEMEWDNLLDVEQPANRNKHLIKPSSMKEMRRLSMTARAGSSDKVVVLLHIRNLSHNRSLLDRRRTAYSLECSSLVADKLLQLLLERMTTFRDNQSAPDTATGAKLLVQSHCSGNHETQTDTTTIPLLPPQQRFMSPLSEALAAGPASPEELRHSESVDGDNTPGGSLRHHAMMTSPTSVAYVCIWTSETDVKARRYFTGKPASLWRPVVTQGHAPFGDVLVEGCSPPSRPVCVAPRHHPGAAAPVRFRLAWRLPKTSGGGVQLTLWNPVPPAGYVALGCVAVAGSVAPSTEVVCCLHRDYIVAASTAPLPIWRLGMPHTPWASKLLHGQCFHSSLAAQAEMGHMKELEVNSWGRCGLWGVNSAARTFFVSWGTAAPAAEALFSPSLHQTEEVDVNEHEEKEEAAEQEGGGRNEAGTES